MHCKQMKTAVFLFLFFKFPLRLNSNYYSFVYFHHYHYFINLSKYVKKTHLDVVACDLVKHE